MEDEDSEGSRDPGDALFDSNLRNLRKALLEADEAEREEDDNGVDESNYEVLLSNQQRLLRYDEYLASQRYYDDLKFIDYDFIDFGIVGENPVVVAQDKSLGKGGFCWDAAFVLAEYVLEWVSPNVSMIELGAGTGTCGILVARAWPQSTVVLTDLSKLMDLLHTNASMPYPSHIQGYLLEQYPDRSDVSPLSNLSIKELAWGETPIESTHDVILGADVVASIYDPRALAETIRDLATVESVVYISFKERLSSVHREFERLMADYFGSTEILQPVDHTGDFVSRNRNPDIRIFRAQNKKT